MVEADEDDEGGNDNKTTTSRNTEQRLNLLLNCTNLLATVQRSTCGGSRTLTSQATANIDRGVYWKQERSRKIVVSSCKGTTWKAEKGLTMTLNEARPSSNDLLERRG